MEEEKKRYERVCTGETVHQFTAETDGDVACPECGAPAKPGLAVSTPAEPFAELTGGADQWYQNLSTLIAFLQLFHWIAIANWFASSMERYYQAAIGTAVARGLRNLRPLSWYQAKVIPGFEQLRVDLSLKERAECADEMARLAGEIDRNESAKKAINAFHKEIDERLHKELNALSIKIREGEYRNVAVDTIHDLGTGTCARVRRDTGEIISERPLEADERQAVLFDDQAATKPATVDGGKKNGNGKTPKEKRSKKPRRKMGDGAGDEARA